MKPLLLSMSAGLLGLAVWSPPMPNLGQEDARWTIVVGGSSDGYMSPCGCTKPMAGGIRRRATVSNRLTQGRQALVLELGPLAGGAGRQNELKAESLAQAMTAMKVDVLGLSAKDAALGAGMVGAISRLSGGALTTASVSNSQKFDLKRWVKKGPFLVTSWSPDAAAMSRSLQVQPLNEEGALGDFLMQAEGADLVPIVLFQGNIEQAKALAARRPQIKLIVFESKSQAPTQMEMAGKTALISPGEKGKQVVSVSFESGSFSGYRVRGLGPEIADDESVSRFYKTYLARLGSERLLDRQPRRDGPAFVGTPRCISCHEEEGEVWKKTKHATALDTLEEDGHDRDPDCVSCHVVGLDSVKGFKSRAATPHLAAVGCESCHGPGKAHSDNPKKVGIKNSTKVCKTCHVPEHSPDFDFDTFWPKVEH